METMGTKKRPEGKKPYTGLKLVEYGELRQLTLGVGSVFADGHSGTTSFMDMDGMGMGMGGRPPMF